MGVTFSSWQTPFSDAKIEIIDLCFGNGGVDSQIDEHGSFKKDAERSIGMSDLSVRVLVYETREVCQLHYKDVFAFRVVDEGGLNEIWQATSEQGGRPGETTFRVAGHTWSKENEFGFANVSEQGAFMLATDWDCLEVLCIEPPEIKVLEKI